LKSTDKQWTYDVPAVITSFLTKAHVMATEPSTLTW